MNELQRLSNRVKLAKSYCNGESENGRYHVYTYLNGDFEVCAMTGAVLAYTTIGGREFRGPDVQPEHDIIIDKFLDRWQHATDSQLDMPAITFFPDHLKATLPDHIKQKVAEINDLLASQPAGTASWLTANDPRRSD